MSDKYAALGAAAEKAGGGEWRALIDVKSKTYSVHTPDDNGCGDVVNWSGFDGQKRAADKARFIAAANPATILALLAERDADKARIEELSESHSKLRDTIAAIHNTIRMDGGYTPLAAIINAARRAHEESAVVAAGITLETGE